MSFRPETDLTVPIAMRSYHLGDPLVGDVVAPAHTLVRTREMIGQQGLDRHPAAVLPAGQSRVETDQGAGPVNEVQCIVFDLAQPVRIVAGAVDATNVVIPAPCWRSRAATRTPCTGAPSTTTATRSGGWSTISSPTSSPAATSRPPRGPGGLGGDHPALRQLAARTGGGAPLPAPGHPDPGPPPRRGGTRQPEADARPDRDPARPVALDPVPAVRPQRHRGVYPRPPPHGGDADARARRCPPNPCASRRSPSRSASSDERTFRRAFKRRFGFIPSDASQRLETGPEPAPGAVLRNWIESL
ncbi:helix-turn-helix domain-containing protein [Methylobacterium oryzae CBMB20]